MKEEGVKVSRLLMYGLISFKKHNRSISNGSSWFLNNTKKHGVQFNTSSWSKILHVHKNENFNTNTEITKVKRSARTNVDNAKEENKKEHQHHY